MQNHNATEKNWLGRTAKMNSYEMQFLHLKLIAEQMLQPIFEGVSTETLFLPEMLGK